LALKINFKYRDLIVYARKWQKNGWVIGMEAGRLAPQMRPWSEPAEERRLKLSSPVIMAFVTNIVLTQVAHRTVMSLISCLVSSMN